MSTLEDEALKQRIENLKKYVSTFQVLRHYGVSLDSDREQQISCPFPENHSHGDATKSCRVYDDGWIFCYGCMDKQMDSIKLTMSKEKLPFTQAIWVLEKRYGVPTAHLHKPVNLKKHIDAIFASTEPEIQAVYKVNLERGERILLENRTLFTAEQYVALFGVHDDLVLAEMRGMEEEKLDEYTEKWLAKIQTIARET